MRSTTSRREFRAGVVFLALTKFAVVGALAIPVAQPTERLIEAGA
jgi:hypothetical protein